MNAQRTEKPGASASAPAAAPRDATVQPRSSLAATAPAMTVNPAGTARTNASNPNVAPASGPGSVADPQAMRPINRHLQTPQAPTPAPAPANAPTASNPAAPPLSRATTPVTPAATQAKAPADANDAAPAPAKEEPKAAPATASRPDDAAPALPQYYELAYAVRKDIPPFGLSMHVYAADAAGRFVVVDGDRKVEGDAIKEGLALREIRPDGMILEFRGQRFFYPRPGH